MYYRKTSHIVSLTLLSRKTVRIQKSSLENLKLIKNTLPNKSRNPVLQVINEKTACYKTTNHRQATDYQQPTSDHRQATTDSSTKCSTDPLTIENWPPTHRQVLHRHSNRSSTDPLITDSPTLIQLTTNPLIHQTYFNKATIGSMLSIINFNSLFGIDTHFYFFF